MTGRARRTLLPSFVFALVASVSAAAAAAEIAGQSVTFVYDDAIWDANSNAQGEPELACAAEECGGDSAACSALTVRPETALSEAAFLGAFRQALARATLDNARTNVDGASPEIVSSPAVATFGGNTGVSLSLRIAFDGIPTRIDYFWLRAGANLAGVTCLVADAAYERARPAFETIFAEVAVRAP